MMASTSEMSDRAVIISLKVKITTRQNKSFKKIRQKYCNSVRL